MMTLLEINVYNYAQLKNKENALSTFKHKDPPEQCVTIFEFTEIPFAKKLNFAKQP
jgi:hypothetical protein